jgi:hypothetical protein
MTKHVLTFAFLLFFAHFAAAQLTLQQVDGTKKHVIPAGASIDLTFPIKTSGLPEKAVQIYYGRLKKVDNTGVGIVITYENRFYTNENGITIHETRDIHPPDTPIVVQIPLTKMQSIVQYPSKKRTNISNLSAYVFFLAIASNLFVAPHLKEPQRKMVSNAGFIVMGVGLTVGLLPTTKKYYLEQPKGGNKKLWRIVAN